MIVSGAVHSIQIRAMATTLDRYKDNGIVVDEINGLTELVMESGFPTKGEAKKFMRDVARRVSFKGIDWLRN